MKTELNASVIFYILCYRRYDACVHGSRLQREAGERGNPKTIHLDLTNVRNAHFVQHGSFRFAHRGY